jgi:hypothetical protein
MTMQEERTDRSPNATDVRVRVRRRSAAWGVKARWARHAIQAVVIARRGLAGGGPCDVQVAADRSGLSGTGTRVVQTRHQPESRDAQRQDRCGDIVRGRAQQSE